MPTYNRAGAQLISFVKPMNTDIRNWHVVKTKIEMIQKAIEILNDPTPTHQPVIPFHIEDTVKKMAGLFSF